VVAITEDSPGVADTIVLARAAQEGRTILTFDRDYGELIFYRRLPTPAGAAESVLALLDADQITLEGMFTAVGETQVRQRALP